MKLVNGNLLVEVVECCADYTIGVVVRVPQDTFPPIRVWKLGDHKENVYPAQKSVDTLLGLLEKCSNDEPINLVWDSMVEVQELRTTGFHVKVGDRIAYTYGIAYGSNHIVYSERVLAILDKEDE